MLPALACYAYCMKHFKISAWLCLPLLCGLSWAQAKGDFRPDDKLSICPWAEDDHCEPLGDAQIDKYKMLPEDIQSIQRIQTYAHRPSVKGDELVATFGSPLGRIQPNGDVLMIWTMGDLIRHGTAVLMTAREETIVRTIFQVGNEYSVMWTSSLLDKAAKP